MFLTLNGGFLVVYILRLVSLVKHKFAVPKIKCLDKYILNVYPCYMQEEV